MSNKQQVFSFDIFDTCLVRTCGESYNVFYILAKEILGDDAELSQINDFVLIRKRGEEYARKALVNEQNEEITLK